MFELFKGGRIQNLSSFKLWETKTGDKKVFKLAPNEIPVHSVNFIKALTIF